MSARYTCFDRMLTLNQDTHELAGSIKLFIKNQFYLQFRSI